MEKNKKRARRRQDSARVEARARKIGERLFNRWIRPEGDVNKMVEDWACRHADNLKAVKCYCCCNPRRNPWNPNILTMQERKIKDIEKTFFD